MSYDILDLKKWENEYPFLNGVSELYDEFNNDEYVETSEHLYDTLCFTIINYAKGNVEQNKYICKKLMRNLKYFSLSSVYYEVSNDYCNILFHWLYNSLEEGKITYPIIDECFDTYNSHSLMKGNTVKKCHYHKNSKFHEPTKITLLDIFNDKTQIIKDTLKDVNVLNSNRGRKYVCECVKIYKYMKEKYCDKGKSNEEDYKSTCIKLDNFRQSYDIFYNSQVGSIFEIPSLYDKDKEFLAKCPPDVQDKLLRLDEVDTQDASLGERPPEPDEYPDGPLSGELRKPLGSGDNSMKKSITTTIGTVAGASSLLALLYKVNTKINLNIRTIIYKCVYTKYT
ncbi:hypothetical protein PVIIG_05228 [Plasmodium vivax India VII]|uniref:Variable surface protein n=1 Tax=Plasmodium vivax India VII TaxID=1077284 RepID=A0A0J9S2M4_PLAVI|nr:hypothetical protein PVIIG_05228 [Plasmodium vivax India VII]